MEWLNNIWKRSKDEVIVDLPDQKTIDVMADDTDPEEVTIENAYKTRWIWYHTILALEILMTNLLLLAIMIILAVKL